VVMTARAELDERAFTEEWGIGSTLTQAAPGLKLPLPYWCIR
jgi:hypothetical protein